MTDQSQVRPTEPMQDIPANWPECEDFFNLMQAYRHTPIVDQRGTVRHYEEVKGWLREEVKQMLAAREANLQAQLDESVRKARLEEREKWMTALRIPECTHGEENWYCDACKFEQEKRLAALRAGER